MNLTREQILNAEAGPELNAWIAEYVMEWVKVIDTWSKISSCYESGWYINTTEPLYLWHPNAGDRKASLAWNPSTLIADAWPVIDKIKNRMWRIVRLPDAGMWEVCFIDVIDFVVIEAPTAPLAICHVALLTKLEHTESKGVRNAGPTQNF